MGMRITLYHVLAALLAFPSLFMFFSHWGVDGVPSSWMSGDHPAHFYKTYLVYLGTTRAVHWYNVDLFPISPAFFGISWVFTRVIPDSVLAYKFIVMLSDVLLVAVAVLLPVSAPAILVLQYMNISHGVIPTVYAFVFGFIAAWYALRLSRWWESFIVLALFVLSLFFQPTVGGIFFLLLALIYVDRVLRADLSSLHLLVIFVAAGVIGLYYSVIVSTYPNLRFSLRLWTHVHPSFSSPYFWFAGNLPVYLWAELYVLIISLLSALYLLYRKKWLYGTFLLGTWLYFVLGPAIPGLRFLPVASAFPYVYLTFLLYASSVLLYRINPRFLLVILFFSLIFVWDLYESLQPWFRQYTWRDLSLEDATQMCGDVVRSHSIAYIFSCSSGNCNPYWMATAYLNAEYNILTPQGWIVEIMPSTTYRDLSSIEAYCERGDVNALHLFLKEKNAFLILIVNGEWNSPLLSSAVCRYRSVYFID